MPIRIVHTADVHLDTNFTGRLGPAKGQAKREAIRRTFSSIIDGCLDWPADILLIAGDLFEEERVTAETMRFLHNEFERLGETPAVIAPGNHDPFTAGSRYAVYDWPPNVLLFTSPQMQVFSFPDLGLDVYGLAHNSAHMSGRLLDAVSRPGGAAAPAAVLLAHASDETSIPAEKAPDDIWLPFGREELGGLGFSYAALGHYHGASRIESNGRVIAAYPGSPEGLRFGEEGRRRYSRVTIEGDAVTIEPVEVSQIDFHTCVVHCGEFAAAEEFWRRLGALDFRDPGSIIARVKATGRAAPEFTLGGEVPDAVRDLFFHITIEDETVPAYDWDELAAENSLRGEVARRFAAELAEAAEDARPVLEKARLYVMDALKGHGVEAPREALEGSRSVD